MTTMEEIAELVTTFAAERAQLRDEVDRLEQEVAALRRARMPALRAAVSAAAVAYDRLHAAIDGARDLFRRPRSVVVEGVRVGVQKGKGRLDWGDDATVCRLIRRHMPDQADVLIKTVEKPSKPALARLPAAKLKRIGVTVEDAGDEVLIKPADSEIDKLVAKMLADADEAEPVGAAAAGGS